MAWVVFRLDDRSQRVSDVQLPVDQAGQKRGERFLTAPGMIPEGGKLLFCCSCSLKEPPAFVLQKTEVIRHVKTYSLLQYTSI
jgi:hypothetical protein